MISLSQLRARAFAAVPGYDVATKQLAELKELANGVRVVGMSEAQARDALIDGVIAGGPIPLEPDVEILAARATTAAAEVREQFYRNLATHVEANRESLVEHHHREVFTVLAAEVTEIRTAMLALDEIPLTADAAIDTDRVGVFRAANELVDAYTVVGVLHAEMFKMIGADEGHQMLNRWLRPETVMQFHPPTRHRLTGALSPAVDGNGHPFTDNSWPGYDPDRDVGVWPVADDDRVAWLQWAARVNGLWVPTPAELRAAKKLIADTINQAIANVNGGRPAREERAVDAGVRVGLARAGRDVR